MKKLLKKSLAVIMVAAMLLCVVPFTASAASSSGTCGDNLTWSYDGAGMLTISGTGDMYNWTSHSDVPWYFGNVGFSITSVKINNGVTSIGDRAFYDCTALTSVTLPNSLKSIGSYAFRYCQNLETVKIPDSVTYIGDYAFVSCQSLVSVTIPSGVTSIGAGTFSNCVELKSVTIPYGVTSIGVEAFYGCWVLPSITIPDSVTGIGDCAFQNCWELATISMPDKAMELGSDIFRRTAYQDNAKNWNSGAIYVGNHLVSVQDVTVSDDNFVSGEYAVRSGTKSIANVYFRKELTGITIPATVGYIGKNCFSDCNNLKYIKVNSSNAKYTSDSANVLYDKNKTTLIKYPAASTATSYTVPDTVVTIKDNAFNNAVNLKTVTLGSKVEGVGNYAFYGCKALTAISFGSSVKRMGEGAFENCDKITSIILPEKLTEIASDIFYSCDSLKSVSIGSNVTEIGARAFAYCRALESITVPGNVETIGLGAFAYCTGVTSVVIYSGVKSIGQVAFGAMTSLEYIHIPSSVTTISEDILTESTGYICSDSSSSYAISFAKANGYSYKVCDGHGSVTPVVKKYTLSYNANGGSGAPASQSGAASYTVSSAQPTRSGYTFLGWSKSSTATSASYKAGDSITLTANITLYAVWQKNAVDPTPDNPTPDNPTPDNPSTDVPEIKIKRTSTTKINFGDTLVLQLEEVEIPEGYAVAWFVEGAGVSTWVSEDGLECRVTSIANGNPTIFAKLVDADENVITDTYGEEIFDEITLTSKAGFWQKFISFFKNLFGINRVIY